MPELNPLSPVIRVPPASKDRAAPGKGRQERRPPKAPDEIVSENDPDTEGGDDRGIDDYA